MPVTSVSGLGSGIDWQSIVDQLMQIEHQPINRIQQRQSEYKQKVKLWQDINTKITTLRSASETLRSSDAFAKFSSSLSSSSSTKPEDKLNVSLDDNAAPGTYDITINQVAQKQKISSKSFSTKDESLNLSGEMLINGQVISIDTTDTLQNIRTKINNANSGENATKVSASILQSSDNDFRLVLTSEESGSEGFDLLAGDGNSLIQDLGLTSSTTSLRTQTSDGAKSDGFQNASEAVGSALGLSNAQSGTVQIGGQAINIDLSTDSLVDIAGKIDAATGLSASVVSEEDSDGNTVYRVDVSGSTDFVDSNNILQTLGFVENTFQDINEVHSSDVANSATAAAGGGAITSASTFGSINTGSDSNDITNGDTISITGTDHNGNAINSTFTITDKATNTVNDFLTNIENAFGGSGNVDVYISDGTDGNTSGTLVLQDLVAGDSQMTIDVVSNNEGGGTLNFGTMAAATEGRSMELQAGQNASLSVDGVVISRSSNTINDAIEGVNLDVLSADTGTTVTVNVSRDVAAIKKEVNRFISAYNDINATIGQQFRFSEENGPGGPLFGDGTLRSVQNDIRNVIVQQVQNITGSYTTLGMVGINLDNEGKLSLDDSTFTDAIQTNFQDVQDLFIGTGTSANSQIQYITHSRDTNDGIYDVNITQAATKASVTGTTDLSGGLTAAGAMQLMAGSSTASFNFNADDSLDTIIAAMNSEFNTAYTEALSESLGHSDLSGSAVTGATTLDQIDTAGSGTNDLAADESIGITGTTRSGATVSATFSLSDPATQTVGDLLQSIEDTFNGKVTASVDSTGKIQLEDNTSGTSQLGLTLTYNGAGSLAFGTMDESIKGRYQMELTASKSASNELVISNDNYGSSSFDVTADAPFGITSGNYSGVDVAGTINGESATGKGQVLTGDSGQANIDGLVVRYAGSAIGNVGNMTVSYGVGELMYQDLYNVVDIYDGYVSQKINSLNDSIRNFDDDISQKESQLEIKRQNLVKQFLAMESTVSGLNAQSNWLAGQLNGLMTKYM